MTDGAERSKAEQFAALADGLLGPPEADHVPGWCSECDQQVRIDTGLRPFGMAESCEEHLPLCQFQEGSRHA